MTQRTGAAEEGPARGARTPERRGWVAAILHRWPTWLAIAFVALAAGGDPGSVEDFSEILLLFPLIYLAPAVLQRRQATWVVLVVTVGAVSALRLQSWVEPWVVILAVALAFVLWGAARGQMWPPGTLMVETAGMVVFAAIALAAMSVNPDLGLYLVAAGWAGHSVWDFVHLLADRRVVSRSYAEWCAVVDLLGAVSILAVAML